MAVLERPDLEASPLADLHAIADQIGLDGFRRLRKAELIDAILGETGPARGSQSPQDGAEEEEEEERPRPRRRRPSRSRRASASPTEDSEELAEAAESAVPSGAEIGARRGRGRSARAGATGAAGSPKAESEESAGATEAAGRIAEGVVEVLGNGSAFLRVDPPEPSDEDVYISAAQVRRCELVSGDRVTGPVRTPRRSERYPSLVRIDTINGASADSVADGARYEDLPVA